MEFGRDSRGEVFRFDTTEAALFAFQAKIDGPLAAEKVNGKTAQQRLMTDQQEMLPPLIAGETQYQVFHRALRRERGNFFEAIFEKADLSGTDFTGSNLFGAEFLGSVLEGTKLNGANLRMTKLA